MATTLTGHNADVYLNDARRWAARLTPAEREREYQYALERSISDTGNTWKLTVKALESARQEGMRK